MDESAVPQPEMDEMQGGQEDPFTNEAQQPVWENIGGDH